MGSTLVIEFPVLEMILKLLFVALLPTIIGVVIHLRWLEFCLRIQKPMIILVCGFLILIVWGVVKSNRGKLPELLMLIGPTVLTLVSTAMLVGYLIAYAAKLAKVQGGTLSIEIGIQNAAIALMVTGGFY